MRKLVRLRRTSAPHTVPANCLHSASYRRALVERRLTLCRLLARHQLFSQLVDGVHMQLTLLLMLAQ